MTYKLRATLFLEALCEALADIGTPTARVDVAKQIRKLRQGAELHVGICGPKFT